MEEKDRRTCWQGRNEDVAGEEANLKTKLEDDVNGAKTRCADMIELLDDVDLMEGIGIVERTICWHL